jgi:TolB protein
MLSFARTARARLVGLVVVALLSGCDGAGGTSLDAETPSSHSAGPASSSEVSSPIPSALSTPSGSIDLATLSGKIAFAAGVYPDLDLYVVNADGSGFERLTGEEATEFDPSWSPDGRRIAYRHQVGANTRETDIHVLDLESGRSRNVSGANHTPDWGPAWSPDGSQIAWNTSINTTVGFDLGLVRPNGSGRHVVRAEVWIEYPTWSPDGRQIAFMSQIAAEGNQYEVFVMDADGSNVRRLTDNPAVDGWPTWSPDGSTIAFSSTRDDCRLAPQGDCLSSGDIGPFHTLYTMAPDGSDQRRVSTLYAQIADWSPDGGYLVFEGHGGLTLVSRDGSATGTIPVAVTDPSFPDWIH